jgi:uncharacterized oligopeptide transporter (OPT) family protein
MDDLKIGALQAGDLMQDLKTGHLVDASPKVRTVENSFVFFFSFFFFFLEMTDGERET